MSALLTDPITVSTPGAGTRIDLGRCAEVSVRAAALAFCRSAMDVDPSSPVALEISFEDASAYGMLRIWQVREIDNDGQRFVAMDGQIVEMGSEGFSYPVQENCTLLLPAITLTKNASVTCYLSTLV